MIKDLLRELLPYLVTAGGLVGLGRWLLPWYRRLERRKLAAVVAEKEAVVESLLVKSANDAIVRLTEEVKLLWQRVGEAATAVDKANLRTEQAISRAGDLNEQLAKAATHARELVTLYEQQITDLRRQLAEAHRALGQ